MVSPRQVRVHRPQLAGRRVGPARQARGDRLAARRRGPPDGGADVQRKQNLLVL